MEAEKPTIILIENDPLSLSLYERELSPYFSLVVCGTESRAQAALLQEKVELVILEPANGNQWAWNFLDKLQADRSLNRIPVIFCTVLDERKKALEWGAAAYLIKPVYANVLRQHAQELLVKQGGAY
ncbi:MAG: hypothetical protein R6X34_26440 [Chloroflexota bacterium]